MPLRRRVAARRSPKVSVIVPVFAVEPYLQACLESIAAQPVADHEVVVVDDGSPDASVEIVMRRMRRDGRIRLIRQSNAGLGAARNAGVHEAQGEFLAFVDSDDVLPPDAWGPMLASLERTGSDFAVGKAVRDDGARRWATPLMERNHQNPRAGVTLAQVPLMLADVFAWNKLFRRRFWDDAGLSFPTGTRYEDQPAMTKAFLASRSFDVLTETVYRWAVREDQSSITQRRHEWRDLVDRLETKRESARLVRGVADSEVLRVFYSEVLPVDMWEYFRAVPGNEERYWELLRDGVRELWNEGTVPFHDTRTPPQQRLMGWLVAEDRRRDLELLLSWVDSNRPLPFTDDGELAHPWQLEPGTPTFRRA